MKRPGVTMMLLWSEYCDEALGRGREPYMYSAFCSRHKKWARANDAVMHIEHKPAHGRVLRMRHRAGSPEAAT